MAVVVGSLAIDEPTAPATDKLADTVTHTTTEGTVEREVVSIGDPDNTRTANRVACLTGDPGAGDVGLVTRNLPSGTQPVSVASLPLPASAATEATLAGTLVVEGTRTNNTAAGAADNVPVLASVARATPPTNTEGRVVVLSVDLSGSLRTKLEGVTITANRLLVDGSGVTQPVSGTITASQGSPPWTMRMQDGAGATLATVNTDNQLHVILGAGDGAAGAATINDLFDLDSGAGSEFNLGVAIRAAASGGSVGITGDVGNGLDVDVTRVGGTVTVAGTVTADAGTNLNTSALALETTLAGDLALDASHTRNEAFKEAVAVGGELDDATPVAATEGNVSPVRITAHRSQHMVIRDPSAERAAQVTAANNLSVDLAEQTGSPVRVRGADADGAAITGDPVLVAGDDGANVSNLTVVAGTVATLGSTVGADSVNNDNLVRSLEGDGTLSIPLVGAMTYNGASWDRLRSTIAGGLAVEVTQPKTIKTAIISDNSSGENTIIAAVASNKIKVFAVNMSLDGSATALWRDGPAGSDLTGAQTFEAREGYTIAVNPPAFLFATSVNTALILTLGAGVFAKGWVSYWDDDTT